MKITCGIYLVRPNKTILICKATGGGWSIPKGLANPNEHPELAARRELLEETNIDLSGLTLQSLPDSVYKNGKKVLVSFVGLVNMFEFDLKCNSTFGKDNLPEVCEFKWATFEEAKDLLHESQVSNLLIVSQWT